MSTRNRDGFERAVAQIPGFRERGEFVVLLQVRIVHQIGWAVFADVEVFADGHSLFVARVESSQASGVPIIKVIDFAYDGYGPASFNAIGHLTRMHGVDPV